MSMCPYLSPSDTVPYVWVNWQSIDLYIIHDPLCIRLLFPLFYYLFFPTRLTSAPIHLFVYIFLFRLSLIPAFFSLLFFFIHFIYFSFSFIFLHFSVLYGFSLFSFTPDFSP